MYLNRRGVQGLRKTQGGEARQGWAARRGGGDVEGSWRGRRSRRRGRPSPRSAPSSLNRSGLERSWSQRGQDPSGTWPFKTLSTRNRWEALLICSAVASLSAESLLPPLSLSLHAQVIVFAWMPTFKIITLILLSNRWDPAIVPLKKERQFFQSECVNEIIHYAMFENISLIILDYLYLIMIDSCPGTGSSASSNSLECKTLEKQTILGLT